MDFPPLTLSNRTSNGSIAVADFGMGNLRSVAKALEKVAPGVTTHIEQ